MLVRLDQNGTHCWAPEIRKILSNTGFYFVWLQQGVSNVNSFLQLFKARLRDVFIQEWSGTIRDRERYSLYCTIKTRFEEESYLQDVNIYCFRVALTQFRLGVLPINNNLQRHYDCPSAKNCVFCKNVIEDESHFLLDCPLYSDLRNRFFTDLPSLNVIRVLRWKNERRCQQLSQYLFHAVKRRQKYVDSVSLSALFSYTNYCRNVCAYALFMYIFYWWFFYFKLFLLRIAFLYIILFPTPTPSPT